MKIHLDVKADAVYLRLDDGPIAQVGAYSSVGTETRRPEHAHFQGGAAVG